MEPPRALVDWRPLPAWSKADFNRPSTVATVSSANTQRAFGPGVTELTAQAPMVWTLDDAVALPWMQHAVDQGYDRIETKRQVIWESADGRQKMYALNLARRAVAIWFADMMVEHYPHTDGWHLDYGTSLRTWIRLKYENYWNSYNGGLQFMIRRYRKKRPEAKVLAQQYSWRWYLEDAHGLFVERNPLYYGQTFDQHRRDSLMFRGTPPLYIFELLEPALGNPWFRQTVRDFVASVPGAHLSEGRQ